ncbi:DUF4365 domain-containing protein [Acutalibacter muris]|uniref:DUF4365 domain-containing protein n=2 Tax=Acutalibacter muris TaxID=1796620 RepID=UPI00272ABCDD|nr:DUF4365 domain-containing protein [Acutalibacter muris]
MTPEQAKEDMSISYISAVCAYAGVEYDTIRHDGDSTDGLIKKLITIDGTRKFAAQMRVQLKCTSSLTQYKDNGDSYTYTLKVKNYNDLIRPATTPIILGLLILPADETIWLEWTEEELRIKGCMYWADFSGFTESTNSHSIDVRIDKKNVLNSSTIVRILEDSAREDCS